MNAGTIRNAGGKINKAVPEYKPGREPVRGKADFYRLTNAAKKKKIGGSMNEVIDVTNNNDVPAIADDQLLAIARQAEARIDAVIKIKQLALKVTNASDWTDQQGKPYLQASGSEKVANLFNISWRIDEPTMEEETDGAITYIYKGAFSLGGRTIEVEGSRSSRDEFFKKYEWKNGQKVGEKPLDRRDLKMAAMTNLLGNGITRILGIRNLTWEDLEQYAKIKKEQVSRVEYKTKGENKQPLKEPQKKGEGAPVSTIKDPDAPATEPQLKAIHALLGKLNISDELEKHKKISRIIGLPEQETITTTAKLTKGQASKVIETLTAEGTAKAE